MSIIWTPEIEKPNESRLGRWFGRKWPPRKYGLGSLGGCNCCKSAPSSSGTPMQTCAAACCAMMPNTIHLTLGSNIDSFLGPGACRTQVDGQWNSITLPLTFSSVDCSWNGTMICGTGNPAGGADGINHFTLKCCTVSGSPKWVLFVTRAYCGNSTISFCGGTYASITATLAGTCSPLNLSGSIGGFPFLAPSCFCDGCAAGSNTITWTFAVTL